MTRLVRFDWAIKYLLRNKANFDILEGFLSELLKTGIKIETILDSESNKNHVEDKLNRVDLLALTADGQHVIIEVQCTSQYDYLSRILYGTSKATCEYMRAGDAYCEVRKVISVSIVFFDLGEGKDYLYHGKTSFTGIHCHDTLNLNAKERDMYGQSHGLAWQTPEEVFPEYYIIKVTAFADRVRDKLDEWIYFLKHSKIEKDFAAQGIQSAAHKLDILQLTESERRTYEGYRESLHDEASLAMMMSITQSKKEAAEAKLQTAKDKLQTAKDTLQTVEGKLQTAETRVQIIARSLMQQQSMTTEAISELTGLSMEELLSL